MAEFAYNNAKNANTGHTPFDLNSCYYPQMLYRKKIDPPSQSKSANKLLAEFRELMVVCYENLYYAQKFPKQAHDKGVKPQSYVSGKKV